MYTYAYRRILLESSLGTVANRTNGLRVSARYLVCGLIITNRVTATPIGPSLPARCNYDYASRIFLIIVHFTRFTFALRSLRRIFIRARSLFERDSLTKRVWNDRFNFHLEIIVIISVFVFNRKLVACRSSFIRLIRESWKIA